MGDHLGIPGAVGVKKKKKKKKKPTHSQKALLQIRDGWTHSFLTPPTLVRTLVTKPDLD